MKLLELIKDLDFECVQGSTDIDITTLVYDSRKVEDGSVFVCISGAVRDGHDFAKDVVKAGAKALIVEKNVDVPDDVTVIKVVDTRLGLAVSSAAYFGNRNYGNKRKDNFNLYGSFHIGGIRHQNRTYRNYREYYR